MIHRRLRGAAGGKIELKTLEGREMLVAPVIALVEGVIQASNSTQAELVLAEEFGKVPQAWNGRFAMFDHPTTDAGEKTSANQPMVVDQLRLGTVFNARVEQKKLKMDVWIDTKKASAMGEKVQALVDSIGRGDTVEVSVGVFTASEETAGVYNGRRYSAIWREIIPDHLALLPEGTIGACSIEMGCGTRAAAKGGKSVVKNGKWNDAKRILLQQFIAAQEDDGTSDRDLRMALEKALFAEEAGFLGVVDVFSEAKQVVYAVAPEGETKFFRRGFTVGDDMTVTLDGSPEEVKQVTKYEAAAAATRTAACGCGGSSKIPPTQEVQMDLAKKNRAVAALTKLAAKHPKLYTLADADMFAGASDERLKALEQAADEPAPTGPTAEEKVKAEADAAAKKKAEEDAAAATKTASAAAAVAATAAKPKTEEELLKELPESMRQVFVEHKAASAAKKAQLVTTLKAAQSAYTEPELQALDVPQLEKLAAIAVKTDFSGLGPQRVPIGGQKETVPPPPSLKERLLAASQKKTA